MKDHSRDEAFPTQIQAPVCTRPTDIQNATFLERPYEDPKVADGTVDVDPLQDPTLDIVPGSMNPEVDFPPACQKHQGFDEGSMARRTLKGARKHRGMRRVTFATGPLGSVYATTDGHPPHEGEVARPVKKPDKDYRRPLTRAAVETLVELLGDSCVFSLRRLKMRAGMLPTERPQRPFAKSKRKKRNK